MKTIKLLIIFFVLSYYSPVFATGEIKIAIGEWDPYMSEKLPHYGILVHIITETYKEVGINVKYGFFPWIRSYHLAKTGQWHTTGTWGKTEEREKDFYFSDAVHVGEIVLFYHKDHPIIWTGNLEDLKGLTIGLPAGYGKSVILKKAEKKGFIKYEIGLKEINVFRQLARKRFQAIDASKVAGLRLIETKLSPEERGKIGHTKPIEVWPYYMLFSKKLKENERFLELFNKGFRKMKKSGKIDKMWKAFYRGEYASKVKQ